MVLTAFVSGAGIGLFFGRDDFMGGYDSWPRRLTRLGHIALAALGLFNVVYAISPATAVTGWHAQGAGIALIVGGFAMPAVCFLSAWHKQFKSLFFIPVGSLLGAVILILMG